jgi:integrase
MEKKKAGRPKKTTHSSGLYRKRITIGRDDDGKAIVRAVYGKSQQELENKIAELRISLGMGVDVAQDKSKWKYWANAWKTLTKPTVEVATWANYETALKHLSPLNEYEIKKITAVDVEKIISSKYANGASKRILTLILNTASRVFRLAKKNRVILFDPTEDVKVPQNAKVTKREAVSPEIEEQLWNLRPVAPTTPSERVRGQKLLLMRMFALMQLKCGLRREEVVPLDWEDISFKDGTVTVNKAYNFKEKRIKEPKSKAGYRTVIIPSDYLKELKAWKAQSNSHLVFAYRGGIISEGEFADLWKILLDGLNGISLSDRIRDGQKAAKAKKSSGALSAKRTGRRHKMSYPISFTSHQLRHTFSTNCIAAGIDVRTVQYLMGHATAQMTMGYTHLSQASLSEVRSKMDLKEKSAALKK